MCTNLVLNAFDTAIRIENCNVVDACWRNPPRVDLLDEVCNGVHISWRVIAHRDLAAARWGENAFSLDLARRGEGRLVKFP